MSGPHAFIILTVVIGVGATVAANQCHKWAHQDNPPKMVRFLQGTRIVLGPAHHGSHHIKPFKIHYCIVNGWLNSVLDKLKFFRGLEYALRKLGIEPTMPNV